MDQLSECEDCTWYRASQEAMGELATEHRKLFEAAERYVAAHTLMIVRFHDAGDSAEYTAAGKALEALLPPGGEG